jgi:hypothetical protein
MTHALASVDKADERLVAVLNTLLEAERAGAQTLGVFVKEYKPGSTARHRLRSIQIDEGANCVVLMDLIHELNGPPTLKTGAFLEKAVAVHGKVERLEFLNRGQVWVVRRLREALLLAPRGPISDALQKMLDSHVRNIGACDRLIEEVKENERS